VLLTRQQHETHQIAQRINQGRYLSRQAAARLPNRLRLSPPFAPVPC
jgi:hypothetical protein